MPISKYRISSPLEAGPSLLDAKQLPPQLTSALDYVSARLARKRLHLSLIVIRKDVQIPVSPPQSPPLPPSPPHSFVTSPARSLFSSASSTITRTISKHSSSSSLSSSSSQTQTLDSRTQYASLPNSPKLAWTNASSAASPISSTSSESSSSTPCNTTGTPNPYGLSLMHATTLTPKAEKVLRHTIAKAEKKFGIGSGWLSSQPLSTSSTCVMTNDLIRRSIVQNEVIFSSEGLTLLSLDHVYTFKCCLHTYSRTLSPENLTLAVDELRRLVLAQQGRRTTKGYLMRAYDWLGISLAALVDVNEGYKTAYGGVERCGGIDVQNEERKSPPPLQTNFAMKDIRRMKMSLSFNTSTNTSTNSSTENEDTVEVGESAKGKDISISPRSASPAGSGKGKAMDKFFGGSGSSGSSTVGIGAWDGYGDGVGFKEDRGPHRRGPVTPNGFEDITPVTKGEWCYLMVGDGWKQAKTAAVETC